MYIGLKVLRDHQLEELHAETLKLLGTHGVDMKCGLACEIFRRHGAKVEGQRVRLPAKMIEEALAAAPSEFTMHSRNQARWVTLGTGHTAAVAPSAGVPFMVDETGRQRQADFTDYQNMLRLIQTSPVLDFTSSVALFPEHENQTLASHLQLYYTLTMTDKPLVGASHGEKAASDCLDMILKVNGTPDRCLAIGICNSLSPMAWDARMLESIRVYAERGQAVNISCCVMAGATAPVSLYGALAQSNAEVLAGIVYAQLTAPGTRVIYGTTSSIMDMGTMSLALGTPEYSLISTAGAQLAAHYGLPYRSGGALTDAKIFDAQAGYETALNLFISLNNGVNFMLQGVGILESFMSISFEKWVMDEEVIRRIRHLERDLGEVPDDLGKIIAAGVKAGGFLGLPSTVQGFRKEFYWPHLADRRNYEAWKKQNGDFLRSASDLVKKRLTSYVRPELAPEARRELRKLMESLGCPPPAED